MRDAIASWLAMVARLSGRRAGAALVFHRIDRVRRDPGREVVRGHAIGVLEAQLRHVAACYRVVPAADLPTAVTARRRGRRFPVAITFDDDLPSHRRLAAPLLRHHGLPATFFLTGASLEAPHAFWWELLQAAVDAELPIAPLTGGAEGAGVRELAAAVARLAPEDRVAVGERLCAALAPGAIQGGLDTDDVRALAAAGFEIGAHTVRHHELPSLDDDALERAMLDGRDRLECLAGRPIRVIAYPHGRADARVARAARAAGYAAGFTTHPAPVLPGDDPLLLGRLEPSFSSPLRLALRLVVTLIRRRRD